MTLSKSQINKAGRLLRKVRQGERTATLDELRNAMDVLKRFRASHSTPLTKANNGLRSMMATVGVAGRPTQRLKRVPTIIDKLVRERTMALASMQDIGGCRVVCSDLSQLRRLEERIRRRRPPVADKDYIRDPNPSGYRALHLIVTYDHRLIEVQLRTGPMDEWANAQERVGDWLETDLKAGVGPPELLKLMRLLSVAIAIEEQAETVDATMVEEIKIARRQALSFLKTQFSEGRRP